MPRDTIESLLGITLRELCLACFLMTLLGLITYPIARHYWIKASQNAQIIRNWDEGVSEAGMAAQPSNF